jgi:Cof subfamily protein (haloacid dehalogenase superfamily)
MVFKEIKLIAIDLDGTLLNDEGKVSLGNETAVKQAVSQGIQVIIATGKTRYSAREAMAQLGLRTPGVFIQGLVVCNADGSVRYERRLDVPMIQRVLDFCQQHELDPTAYCHERLLTLFDGPHRARMHERYGEPFAELLPAEAWSKAGVNKVLISKRRVDFPREMRDKLSDMVGDTAVVVQAIPSSIEVLPQGASKGAGVARLLEDLGIAWENVLAIGDGENDIEMLQAAGIGVAMGNANELVQNTADYVTNSNIEDGVANALIRFALT